MRYRTSSKELSAKNMKQSFNITKHHVEWLVSYALCFMFIVFCSSLASGSVKESKQSADTPVITGIDIQDYSVTIRVSKPFTYTLYKPGDPFKVVVELLNVNTGTFNKKILSDKAGITEIVPSQIDTPFMARLEVLLQTPSVAEPEYKDNELKIRIKRESSKELTKEKVDLAAHEGMALPKATEITNISFERSAEIVKVLIKGNGSMTPNIFPLDERIVIDIPDVVMKAELPTTVISPLKGIRSGKHDDKVRLVIDIKEKTDFGVTTIGDSIVVTLSPPMAQKPEEIVEATEEATEPMPITEGKYTGKKISLDFQDADVVPIFRLLADISGYNIVVSPEVKGRLTMKLISVPWDQALDIILKTFSLGKTVENNIIRIASHTAFARENEEAARAKESELKAIPLETKIFPISYADVSNVERAIKDSKILSSRGSISVDKRTSTLTVNDIGIVLSQIENILATLDKPTPQVLIEARIVEVSTKDATALGIQWGISHATATNPQTASKPFRGYSSLNAGPFTGRNFMVDFPAAGVGAGAGAGFAFGILDSTRTMGLDLQLSALASLERSKIISNPRIVTTDNEKASIMQGTSEPFPKVDVQSGQTSVEFKDIAITTEVTPHVTPAGSINMLVTVRKEDILGTRIIANSEVPRTSKVESDTKVLIQNGETLVIGGVLKRSEKQTSSGIPGLMNIPVLGWLFKSKSTEESVTELLIFITPRIVEKPI